MAARAAASFVRAAVELCDGVTSNLWITTEFRPQLCLIELTVVEQVRQRCCEVMCLPTEVTRHEAANSTRSDAPVRSRTDRHMPVPQVPRV